MPDPMTGPCENDCPVGFCPHCGVNLDSPGFFVVHNPGCPYAPKEEELCGGEMFVSSKLYYAGSSTPFGYYLDCRRCGHRTFIPGHLFVDPVTCSQPRRKT